MASITRMAAVTGTLAMAAAPLAGPAQASNDEIGVVASAMLQESDIPAGWGTAEAHLFNAEHGTHRRPWICERGDSNVLGKTSKNYASSDVWLSKDGHQEIAQFVNVYASNSKAKAAWKDAKAKVRKCVGTFVTGNPDEPGGTTYTQKLTNGGTDEIFDGTSGRWIYSNFEQSSAQSSWAVDEFLVLFRSGKSVQIVDFHRAPDQKMTKKLREQVEALAVKLDVRWPL